MNEKLYGYFTSDMYFRLLTLQSFHIINRQNTKKTTNRRGSCALGDQWVVWTCPTSFEWLQSHQRCWWRRRRQLLQPGLVLWTGKRNNNVSFNHEITFYTRNIKPWFVEKRHGGPIIGNMVHNLPFGHVAQKILFHIMYTQCTHVNRFNIRFSP